jgi:hypothetical protein
LYSSPGRGFGHREESFYRFEWAYNNV